MVINSKEGPIINTLLLTVLPVRWATGRIIYFSLLWDN
jgi:hypothetical protein